VAAHDRGSSADGGLLARHATERIFLPLLKLTLPEVVDLHMPARDFHNLVFVSIDKRIPARRTR